MESTHIVEWVERFLETNTEGFYLVDINWNKKSQKLEVFVDRDEGLTLGDCQKLSREMQQYLEDISMLKDEYVLDVSSPGIERPLKLRRQYVKNIGRIINVQLQDGSEIMGRLEKVEDQHITIQPETKGAKGRKSTYGEDKLILWENIKQTIVQIRF